jgi:hypothetical protein
METNFKINDKETLKIPKKNISKYKNCRCQLNNRRSTYRRKK